MLGSYLKQIRKQQNLTLRMVEEKTGISNAYLSQLENNKILHPSPSVLHKLAECYGISYEHLMTLAGYPFPTEKEKLTPTFRVRSSLDDLTPDERERVSEFIQFLKSRRMKR